MSREEDLIRATTRAIASAVREVPPLRLEQAPDELRSPARAPRGLRGGGRPRGWRSWGVPLLAAAVVVALAITLVIVKSIPNGATVPVNSPTSTAGLDGAPRYFAVLQPLAGTANITKDSIVIGDSLTGKTLATFAPPVHTIFQSVTAAADDRTFVVFALTSANGTFGISPRNGPAITGRWYEVRLAPGTAHPASLALLPIKPQTWVYPPTVHDFFQVAPGEVFATALSQSGLELAIADIPAGRGASASAIAHSQEVKVFSVATGRLLDDWTTDDAAIAVPADWTWPDQPVSPLTWIDGDRALALATSHEVLPSGAVTGTVRRLNVAGPASGDLIADSTVLYSGALTANGQDGCYAIIYWPPLVSADGKTISCANEVELTPSRNSVAFDTDPLGTPPAIKPRFDYRVTPSRPLAGPLSVLWTSPSGDTLIGVWGEANGTGITALEHGASGHVGVISHGKFTALRFPSSLTSSTSAFAAVILSPGKIAF
jgi:hypothetical protein